MQLKIYQQNAIEEPLTKAKRLLNYSGSKKFVFKSSTGSWIYTFFGIHIFWQLYINDIVIS